MPLKKGSSRKGDRSTTYTEMETSGKQRIKRLRVALNMAGKVKKKKRVRYQSS